MKFISIKANASQAEAAAQLVNGKSVDGYCDNSFVTTILDYVGDKLPKKIKYLVSYQDAKRAGLKAVFLKGNRKVYNSQLEALWKNAKDSKMFEEGCHVVPLRPILETYPDIETYDLDGNLVTLESPDVDSCFVVYDGQHRITVCELHPGEVDVDLELNEFNGKHPLQVIKSMNSFSRNWNSTDLRVSNVGAGYTTNKLYDEAEKLQSLYGITSKLAEYILTFKREATKKKDLVEGKDTTVYNEEHGNRGLGIFNAIMMNFNEAKEMKKLEVIDAVCYSYDSVSDKKKGNFARNMKVFMGTMKEQDRNTIMKYITDKNYGQLSISVNKDYEAFCEGHSEEELLQKEENVDQRIAPFVQGLIESNQKKAAKNPLKSGRVDEIIQHNIAVKENNEKEELAKAEKKAEEAQKKAIEAQAVVDKLKKTDVFESEYIDFEEVIE